MNEIRKLIPATNNWSDSSILLLFLIFTGFIIFFIYLILFFLCSLLNSSSTNYDEIDQLRRRKNRMKKAYTNSILRRDIIVEVEGNKPINSKEIYTCTTYKPITQINECIFSEPFLEENK
uniref:Uncharacterized protein n=1 Tax=Strongyloides stercoralis TaxID=6248 RepID=A0A0K0EHY1_STRER